jgi:hypothetical protein
VIFPCIYEREADKKESGSESEYGRNIVYTCMSMEK